MHIIFSNTNLDEKLYKKVTYKRGEVVFNSGDICNEIGFVEEGLLSIKTHTYTNDEYEISSLKENTCYGMFLLFSDDPHYLGTCIALKQTTVYIFTKDNLLKALQITTHEKTYINEVFSWDNTIYDLLSISLYNTGKYQESLYYINKAIEMNPNDNRLQENKKIIEGNI
mgnify:CR=1 FL=1